MPRVMQHYGGVGMVLQEDGDEARQQIMLQFRPLVLLETSTTFTSIYMMNMNYTHYEETSDAAIDCVRQTT